MHTTLTVHHNIYLTREERYKVAAGETVVVTGVCVPVWFQRDFTTEPAVEVFAKYHVVPGQPLAVKQGPGGFAICLPPPPPPPARVPDHVWNSLSKVDKDLWYERNEPGPSMSNLLDVRDGGCAFLAFRQMNNMERNKKLLRLVHFVEIKDMKLLEASLS